MIPAIFQAKAAAKLAAGADELTERLQARRLSGAVIGLVSAVGALGGLLINVAFCQSFLTSGSGTTAVAAFLTFYPPASSSPTRPICAQALSSPCDG